MLNINAPLLPAVALEYLFADAFLIADAAAVPLTSPVVEIAEPTSTATKASISFLGGNAQGLVIVNNDDQNKHISDAALQALEKILAKSNLSLQDVAIINVDNQKVTMPAIIEQFTPRKCWLWNVESKQVDISFVIPTNKVFQHGGVQYLFTESLDAVLNNLEAKTTLWNAWKNLITA